MRKLTFLVAMTFVLSSFYMTDNKKNVDDNIAQKIQVSLRAAHHHMVIEWTAASELPGDYYSIEKSFNGKDWLEISTVLAFDEENAFYTEVDDSYEGERCFYRIICVHMDQTFHLTAPIAIVQ